ncbi:MAG: dynamin family protein, partial [Pseudomonadota bacterium]
QLCEILAVEDDLLGEWIRALDGKLLPRFHPDFPLTAAICGGGSSGKSTLFNSLLNSRISPAGGRAGMNRRILFAIQEEHLSKEGILEALFKPFNARPQILKESEALYHPGTPFYVAARHLPKNLALIDTPDFDTGAKGAYVNRDLAKGALEIADILIYIFTNSNYNNRDNTEFISRMLTGIGVRQSFLVYRAYPNFTDEEVCDHAATVAKNIYGDDAEKYILGIYRTDEDNTVASGERFLTLRPARPQDRSFMETILGLNPMKLRTELHRSILVDVTAKASRFLIKAKASRETLGLYLKALNVIQTLSVQHALNRFPSNRILNRFNEIWQSTDPPFVKAMRQTGRVVEIPFRILLKTVRRLKSGETANERQAYDDVASGIEADLLGASNEIYAAAVNSEITVALNPADPNVREMIRMIEKIRHEKRITDEMMPAVTTDSKGGATAHIPAHPVAFRDQGGLREHGWSVTRKRILSQKDELVSVSTGMDEELRRLVIQFRNTMSVVERLRQTFSAVLNIIPATAAVTYILHTGDPIGAAGIKVKLTGLFGLKDLYALVAIPATAGLKKADMKQLHELLEPLVKTWLDHQFAIVNAIFEDHITGKILKTARTAVSEAEKYIQRIEDHLKAIQ